MKKIILALLCAALLFTLISCGDDKTPSAVDTDTDVNAVETEPPIRVIDQIYGMFDEQYDFIYEDICLIPGTFTSDSSFYSLLDERTSEYPVSDVEKYSSRTPTIRYLVEKMGLSEEDVKNYYSAAAEAGAYESAPADNIIALIAGNNTAAAMDACAHPSALSKGGRVFTLRALLSNDLSEYGVTDDDIKATVKRAKEYYGNALLREENLTDEMKEKLTALGFEVIKEKVGSLCSVHSDEYHTIPEALLRTVDGAAFEAWKKSSSSSADDCTEGVNIVSFVKEFSISKENFIEIYNAEGGTLGNYNADVIYGDEADAYYREKHAALEADIAADRAIAALKAKISEDKGMSDFITNVHEFSLAEIVLMLDNDSAYFATLSNLTADLPDLSFEKIYSESSKLLNMIGKRSVYYIDRYVSGRHTFEAPYEAHQALSK